MCTTCGCGSKDRRSVGLHDIGAEATDPTYVASTPDAPHSHEKSDTDLRLVTLEQDLLAKNASFAQANRTLFDELGVLAVNLVSSPGSGKTTLLARTAEDLGKHLSLSVIEGDQHTSRDAERIRAAGVPAIQINTGKICHLDAHMIDHAIERLELTRGGVLFIENVGNLVCPASFDLGEHHKVVILSVTEGEDKPLKYPDMFAAADLMIVNKIDLLPHLDFDVGQCIDYARRIKPSIDVIELSAMQGTGLERWYAWLKTGTACRSQGVSTGVNASISAE